MIRLRFSSALLSSIICGYVSAGPVTWLQSPFVRTPPVNRWIGYQILGSSNHPVPMVYLSVERFDLRAAEFLTVLQPARYDIISKFTRERIARPDCPGEAPTGDVLHSVEVADHDNEETRICILPQRTACEYLSGAVKLRGMDWAAKELAPITDVMEEMGCKIPNKN
jgi:hypothetical protein